MGSAISPGTIFRFGLFEADGARHTLTRKCIPVRIQDQPFRVLMLLLETPGELVTREKLCKKLWPEGTHVDFDGSLNVVLKKLRAAIDDNSDNPRFIETVHRRGYRFIAPVSIEQTTPVLNSTKFVASTPTTPNSKSSATLQKTIHWRLPVLGVLVLLAAASGSWYFLSYHSTVQAAPKVIAVLPFSNEGMGADFDYLRYAIASDLVTDLTYAPSVSVRPFSSTSKYGAPPFDPVAVGKELSVTHVLTGGFLRDQQNLRVDLELIDVRRGQVVCRDEITVKSQELIALHDKLAVAASQLILAAMKIPIASQNDVPRPKNEEAFDLFLRSLAIPLDPEPNQEAIHTLERSVSLDSEYADTWSQLSWRYYIDFHYGNGGLAAREKSLQASRRHSELDPSTPPIATTIQAEEGDLDSAYDQAAEFLRRRPDYSLAHFWMGHVLRYAGLLEEAAKQCDEGFALDPGFNVFRSCAITFIMAGDYAHAEKYIDLDESSGFAALLRMDIALRTRNTAAVLAEANSAAQLGYHDVGAKLARVCLNNPPKAELTKAVTELEADPVSSRDPELLYQDADAAALCGQPDVALSQLRKAIQGSYCSYPALDRDPLFSALRQRPEFEGLRSAGIQCQQNFLAHRKQFDGTLAAAR